MKYKNCKTVAVVLASLLMFILVLVNGRSVSPVYATTDMNGEELEQPLDGLDILDDLTQDPTFSLNDYPVNETDYTLKVVQLAESAQGELLLYVYQPCLSVRKLYATSINMSLEEQGDPAAEWNIYDLELLSHYDVFAKYRVQDFEIKTDDKRYYNISSIFRMFASDIDEGLEEYLRNDITEVSFRVAQFWTVYQDGENVRYDMVTSEVIEVTEQVINKIRIGVEMFDDWVSVIALGTNAVVGADCFYLAFNTDKPIEKLISADLSFDIKYYNAGVVGSAAGAMLNIVKPSANITHKTVKVEHTGKQTVTVNAWETRNEYTFGDRIQRVEDFVAGEEKLTDTAVREVVGYDWVLRFIELGYDKAETLFMPISYGVNNIENASLLRLEFETDGQYYNLGVVDNKQSTSIWKPPAKENIKVAGKGCNLNWKDLWLVWVILGIILLIVCAPLISLLCTLLKNLINLIFHRGGD